MPDSESKGYILKGRDPLGDMEGSESGGLGLPSPGEPQPSLGGEVATCNNGGMFWLMVLTWWCKSSGDNGTIFVVVEPSVS